MKISEAIAELQKYDPDMEFLAIDDFTFDIDGHLVWTYRDPWIELDGDKVSVG